MGKRAIELEGGDEAPSSKKPKTTDGDHVSESASPRTSTSLVSHGGSAFFRPPHETATGSVKETKANSSDEDTLVDSFPSSQESVSSNQAKTSVSKEKAICVSFQFDEEPFQIRILLNGVQRYDTAIEGQGDHHTSYIYMLVALLESVDNQTIVGALDNIRALARALELTKTADLYVEIADEGASNTNSPFLEQLLTTGNRKEIKQRLKTARIDGETAKFIGQALKRCKILTYANRITVMSNTFLGELQRNTGTVSFSKGRINKISGEGTKARTAVAALVAFNRLAEICTMKSEDFSENLPEILRSLQKKERPKNSNSSGGVDDHEDNNSFGHTLRYGLTALLKDAEFSGSEKNKLIAVKGMYLFPDVNLTKALNKVLSSGNALSSHIFERLKELFSQWYEFISKNPLLIAEQVGNLFDCKHELLFDPSVIDPEIKVAIKALEGYFGTSTLSKINSKELVRAGEWETRFPDVDRKKISSSTEFICVTRSLDELCLLVSKHFIFTDVMLRAVKEDFLKCIKRTFIAECVLKKEGWEKAYPPDIREFEQKNQYLLDQVALYQGGDKSADSVISAKSLPGTRFTR